MKQIVLAVFLAGLCVFALETRDFLGQAQARASVRNRILVVPEHVYLSAHNGDVLDLVVEGNYPNSCFRDGAYEIQVDHRAKQLLILNYASVPASVRDCESKAQLYTRKLRVAGVRPGTYRVYFQRPDNAPEFKGELSIPDKRAGYLASLKEE